MSNRPIARVGYSKQVNGQWQRYSLFSIWKSQRLEGMYDVSRDKGVDKAPQASLIDALKWFAAGEGSFSISVDSENYDRPRGNSLQDDDTF